MPSNRNLLRSFAMRSSLVQLVAFVQGARVWHDVQSSAVSDDTSAAMVASIDRNFRNMEASGSADEEPSPQKFMIPAVVDEGQVMKFRDPESIQVLEAEVPKGVRRGESFFVWVLQPQTPGARATVVKAERMDEEFVPVAEPVHVSHDANLTSISTGVKGEALLPGLVPSKGSTSKLTLLEEVRVKDGLIGDTSRFKVMQEGVGQILRFQGSPKSALFGHSTIRAFDRQDKEVFKLRMPKNNWLPGRWTWRVLRPNTTEPLFTITKSIIGSGFLWLRTKWHIYRGRKRERSLLYFCEGDYVGGNGGADTVKCYASQIEKQRPLCTLKQKPTLGAYTQSRLVPDEYTLDVESGQDTGLLTAWSVLYDYTHDHLSFGDKALIGGVVGAQLAIPVAAVAASR